MKKYEIEESLKEVKEKFVPKKYSHAVGSMKYKCFSEYFAEIDLDETILSAIRSLAKNFDPADFESIYYFIETLGDPILALREIFEKKGGEFFEDFINIGSTSIRYKFKIEEDIKAIKEALKIIESETSFNSGTAYLSEKIKDHMFHKGDVRKKYKSALEVHPLLPVYVFFLHRITHPETSGAKGGKLPEDVAVKVFEILYKRFLEFLKENNIKTKANFPKSIKEAYDLFNKKEPEHIFEEYFGL